MLRNYKMTVSYDGTRYNGWQKQKNTETTIQGKLEQILFRLTGKEISVQGAGRTDAGVHALGQVANFRLDTDLFEEELLSYFNEYLPDDIAVLSLKAASERFHSRLSAAGKIYCYRMYTGNAKPVFDRRYMWKPDEIPDAERMRRAASFLMGRHDFKSFCGNRHVNKSTVRNLERISIEESGGGRELRLTFEGEGFLQNMVRILTGTLFECGIGEREPEEMTGILEALERSRAGQMAPAKGLTLMEVRY
ncbi:tRNA pseudouridine(38-40) synthase TruA [Lacrimispora sp. NSJ-141]|uniref:tRNA pseudouridine synthase A n=1 Tax=Lientehia hominis TaxID=2897778 RepID=A0AAP2W928_9FIRM|nr:tRNA pseudouridine(38-40) synthase TruA [Lientehia hominis]MCD2492806.1 tRNA pseudouridine(38-40) synthase TruA [Lientehia hominis]